MVVQYVLVRLTTECKTVFEEEKECSESLQNGWQHGKCTKEEAPKTVGEGSLVELADDVEDALGDLGDEGAHDGAVSQVQHVQAPSRRRVQPVPGEGEMTPR